jgi:hypothetical protein
VISATLPSRRPIVTSRHLGQARTKRLLARA